MEDVTPGFSTAFRVVRGSTGQWEVVEEGASQALARFEAPQAALSYACSVAEARNGSLVVVFDQPRARRPAQYALRGARHIGASMAVSA
jgi:hypothetical protein